MSERDKKFLVGEVYGSPFFPYTRTLNAVLLVRNILKDLYHENIVRYIDRVCASYTFVQHLFIIDYPSSLTRMPESYTLLWNIVGEVIWPL